jgi:hypothetical protein
VNPEDSKGNRGDHFRFFPKARREYLTEIKPDANHFSTECQQQIFREFLKFAGNTVGNVRNPDIWESGKVALSGMGFGQQAVKLRRASFFEASREGLEVKGQWCTDAVQG